MQHIKVWDPAVRLFHWALVAGFGLNALILDDESDMHIWIGYAVVVLIALRVIWGIVGKGHARFADFPPSLSGAAEQMSEIATGRRHIHLGHTPLGALMIYNLLFSIALVGLSGYLMTTDMFWGLEWPEELHELSVGWTEVSVVAHVAAVIFESKRTRVNLPRAMVTGYKDIPDA